MLKLFILSLALTGTIPQSQQTIPIPPEPFDDSTSQHIHLSLGDKPTEMVVTWTTFAKVDSPIVQYGESETKLQQEADGSVTEFQDGGPNHRIYYIHRARLTNLKPLTRYYYRCGTHSEMSNVRWFNSHTSSTDWSPRALVFGDLGHVNGRSIPFIQKEVDEHKIDLIFHNGDIAYQLDTREGKYGDEYMRVIEPFASQVPYQVSVGNHEAFSNFSHYKNRFTMYDMITGAQNNLFYAFHLGPALIIAFSTEHLFFYSLGPGSTLAQKNWLERTLQEANRVENRSRWPWIVALGHRPFYCTCCPFYSECTTDAQSLRNEFEDVFFKYGVDLIIAGHEHNYERMVPVYRGDNYASFPYMYKNPGAPVHIITGAPGSIHEIEGFGQLKPYSVFRHSQYGHSFMHIHNATHLEWTHVDSSGRNAGKIVDQIMLIQEQHSMRRIH